MYEDLWLGTFVDPRAIRSESRLHLFSCRDAASGQPRVVLVGAPDTDSGSAGVTLDALARAHDAVAHPALPPVAGRGRTGEIEWLAFACDAVTDIDRLLRDLIRSDGPRMPYAYAVAHMRYISGAVAAAHRAPGGPFYLSQASWAGMLASEDGKTYLIGIGRPRGGPWLIPASAEMAAPEIKGGLPPTAASDVYAVISLYLANQSQVEAPPELALVLASATGANEPYGASFRPQDRPQSMEEQMALSARLYAALKVEPDLPGVERYIAERVAARRQGHVDTVAIGPGSCICGRYRLLRLLGSGGMGTVYLAHDRALGQPVAVKRLRDDGDAVWRERFRREMRIARAIVHPHIVRGFDLVQEEGALYAVMELVDGPALDTHLAGGLDVAARRALLAEVADALATLHASGIVHRDVKPANILVVPGRGAVLVDFGIAQEPDSELTRTGAVVGTPRWMSPEQARGEPVDTATDVWALGRVIAESFAGDLPADLAALVERCLDQVPEARPLASDVASTLAAGGHPLAP